MLCYLFQVQVRAILVMLLASTLYDSSKQYVMLKPPSDYRTIKIRKMGYLSGYRERVYLSDLLVVDDFSLISLDVNKCRNIFEVIDSREQMINTTSL